MEEHQKRVVAELEELLERRHKLATFIHTPDSKFVGLDALEQTRLIRQYAIMGDYVNVLRERIAAFK
jgi:hypothetical protein